MVFRVVVANGWSMAHEAARRGRLGHDFTQWDLADSKGWTVAHEAAEHRVFQVYEGILSLAADDGWTVAHEAATYGRLPADFDQWEIADEKSLTVLDVLKSPFL